MSDARRLAPDAILLLIDEQTNDAARDDVVAQDLGSLRLAGKGDWVRAFHVLALHQTELAAELRQA